VATIAFPLLVKLCLHRACKYQLTSEDKAQIDVFEKFADISEFLKPPTDQKGSSDSHWKRLIDNRKFNIDIDRAFNQACQRISPENCQDSEKKIDRNKD
jgi:hypothetical protein